MLSIEIRAIRFKTHSYGQIQLSVAGMCVVREKAKEMKECIIHVEKTGNKNEWKLIK